MRRGKAQAAHERPGWRHLLRLLELALLRAYAAAMPGLRKGIAGQGGRCLPLPRLRPVHREVPRMRWLAGNQDRQIRALPWLRKLSRMRLHAEYRTETKTGQNRGWNCRFRTTEKRRVPSRLTLQNPKFPQTALFQGSEPDLTRSCGSRPVSTAQCPPSAALWRDCNQGNRRKHSSGRRLRRSGRHVNIC